MSDERINKIEWATTQPPFAWIAQPALAVIRELQAELRKRDSQDELWRVIRVWRTRANEEFERAEAAEARERAKDEALRSARKWVRFNPPLYVFKQIDAALAQQPADQRHGVYIASKTKHAARWRELRDAGWPIISTWIDEAGVGETACFTDLWRRCIDEARNARAVILYGEPGETLKGALVEVGAALASGVPVIVVGDVEAMKTARNHSLVSTANSVEATLKMVAQQPADNGSLNADTGAHRHCSGKVSDDQPARHLSKDEQRVFHSALRKSVNIRSYGADQPAQGNHLQHKPLSEEARQQGRDALRKLADQPAQGEREHRATLAIVPSDFGGWNVEKDSRYLCGPYRRMTDAIDAIRNLRGDQ